MKIKEKDTTRELFKNVLIDCVNAYIDDTVCFIITIDGVQKLRVRTYAGQVWISYLIDFDPLYKEFNELRIKDPSKEPGKIVGDIAERLCKDIIDGVYDDNEPVPKTSDLVFQVCKAASRTPIVQYKIEDLEGYAIAAYVKANGAICPLTKATYKRLGSPDLIEIMKENVKEAGIGFSYRTCYNGENMVSCYTDLLGLNDEDKEDIRNAGEFLIDSDILSFGIASIFVSGIMDIIAGILDGSWFIAFLDPYRAYIVKANQDKYDKLKAIGALKAASLMNGHIEFTNVYKYDRNTKKLEKVEF